MPPVLLVSAAEPSGDRLAAALVLALRARGPLVARGIAGPAMRAVGVEPLARTESLGVMGISEIFGRLGAIRRARQVLVEAMEAGADAFVGVDSPDFHLSLARLARARGLPAVGYVSPQIWAWRPGRARKIAASLDRMLCLFSFEPPLYPGFDARWVGHPVLDRVRRRDPAEVDPDLVGLLPGSRRQELKRLLPVFLATAASLRERRVAAGRPAPRFCLVLPPDLDLPSSELPSWVARAQDIGGLARASCALTKSGTVTLELAVMGVPQVVAHRVSPLTYALGRLLVRGVRHIALPNVLADQAGRPAPVPEHLQRLDPARIAADLDALPTEQPINLDALGATGASERAAAAVAELWEGRC